MVERAADTKSVAEKVGNATRGHVASDCNESHGHPFGVWEEQWPILDSEGARTAMERLTIKDQLVFTDRLKWVTVIMTSVLALVLLRVAELQILKGGWYRDKATSNSIRLVPRRAPRGLIVDRDGKILAHNKPSYTISVVPSEIETSSPVIPILCRILKLPEEVMRAELNKVKFRRLEMVKVKEQVTLEEVSMVEERLPELPGVVVNVEPRRYYLNDRLSTHLLGYVSQVSEEQVLLNAQRYQPGETVGQDGVEQYYDESLRGRRGSTRILVNARGFELSVTANEDPIMGLDCALTIDSALQEVADRALEGKKGALIAMDPKNGEILALASGPAVPLKNFNLGMDMATWQTIQRNPNKPFYNRIVTAQYAPGSMFKPFVAAAAMSRGVLDDSFSVTCKGLYEFGEWKYRCWKKEGHGVVHLARGLAESCDVFFYQVGLRVKVEGIAEMARKFGFGERTGVDLPRENPGLVPTAEWKLKEFDEPWFPGNTMHYAIGQSYLLATPLQMLVAYALIANEGVAYRPHVVKRMGRKEIVPEVMRRVTLEPSVWRALKQGLWEVVQADSGTGWRARIPGWSVCGKTATVQHVGKKTHAGFVGFAPREHPEILVLAFLEDGGEGGANASPLVKQVMEKWIQLKKQRRDIKPN